MQNSRLTPDPVAVRAWMTSLVLHFAIGAAFAVWAVHTMIRSKPAGITGIETRVMDVSLVLLEPPAVRIASPTRPPHPAPPAPLPPIASAPLPAPTPIAPPPVAPVAEIRPAAHIGDPGPAPVPETQVQPPSPEASPAGAVTAFCGVSAVGQSVVFVVDCSATMGIDGRLDRAKRELTQSLQRLSAKTRFQIVAYNRAAATMVISGNRGLLAATPDAVADAIANTDRFVAEGGTDHPRALRLALSLQPDVVFFLTDDDELTALQVREITGLNRGRSSLHALCFVEPDADSAMPALARGNRGVFRVVR